MSPTYVDPSDGEDLQDERYDADDEASPQEQHTYRVRRQRRAVTTLVIVLLALAGAIYYASSYYRDSAPAAGACSTVAVLPQIKPADVKGVTVLNATKRTGLALAVSKLVAARGFTIKAVGNDPLKKPFPEPAQVRYGPAGESSARLLATHVPGAVLVKDARTDASVDLVLGDGWKDIGPVPPAPTSAPVLPPCPTVTVTR